MGLESVALVMAIEDYFGIKIADAEAEQIHTVQDFTDCIAKQLQVTQEYSQLKDDLYEKLKSLWITNEVSDKSFTLNALVSVFLDPHDTAQWNRVYLQIKLKLPDPVLKHENMLSKTFRKVWKPPYEWQTLTVDDFIRAVCALNYEKLIDPKNIQSTFEILVTITGITADRLGLDIYGVQPHKSFVNDFGID